MPSPISPSGAMRIAVVTTSYPSKAGDPTGHFVASEVAALREHGHEVTVIAPGGASGREASNGGRIVRIPDAGLFGWPGARERLREKPWRIAGALGFVRGARRALGQHGPFNRVVAHWIVPCGFPIALASGAELEVVAHGGDVRLLLGLPHALGRRIVERLLSRGARFRFVSKSLRDQLVRATTSALARASEVRPSPIDLSSAPSRQVARERLGLRAGERLAVIASRLVPSKRTGVALQALALVPDLRVVVVGDGPERTKLERRFERATFVGQLPRPETLSFIAAADVVVSASRDEGAPSVVREARGLGIPVVACVSGDLEAWAERDSGLVVVR